MKNRDYTSRINQIGITDYSSKLMDRRPQFLRFLKGSDVRLFIGASLFIWSWTFVYGFTAYQPQYASRSMVMIKDSAITNRYVDTDQNAVLQTTTSNASNPVLNTMGLLKSTAIMDALWQFFLTEHPEELKRLGIKNKRGWQDFYGTGSQFIKAKNLPGTDLISIQFAWSNPQIAQEGSSVVLKAFHQASLNLNRAEYKNRSMYLDNQVENITQQLAMVRQEKRLFKVQMRTVSINQERDELARTRIALETQLNQVLAQAHGKHAERSNYQQMLGMHPTEALVASGVGQNASMAKLQDQLYTLSENHAFLKATLTDKNPKVQEIREQMQQVEKDINAEMSRTIGGNQSSKRTLAVADPTRGAVAGQLAAAQAEASNYSTMASVLRHHLNEVNQQLGELPAVEEKLANIEQKERAFSMALDTLYQKKLEAHLKEAQTLSNVFVVDQPLTPHHPKFPAPLHLIVLGFLAGLLGGLLSVFSKYKLLSLRHQQPLLSENTEASLANGKPTADMGDTSPTTLIH